MKKFLLIIPITIALAIFFYPTTSNSNSTGSVGGKTGSPTDGASCMECHTDAQQGQGATITTDIPSTGYEPGNTYNITAALNGSVAQGISGFEITCEENTTNTKSGLFGITNTTSTQFANNSSSVTHTEAGNSQNTWSFNWVAPIAGTGNITFYGAFIEAGYPTGNEGDFFAEETLSFNESTIPPSWDCDGQGNCYDPATGSGQFSSLAACNDSCTITAINNMSSKNQIIFNPITKTIEAPDKEKILVYDLEGKLILSLNKKHTSLSHLSNGIYIIKSENNTQKIILN